MTDMIGLFVHYRPVVLALPTGGCAAVANFLGFSNQEQLQTVLDDAGLLYKHPDFSDIATRLLRIELAESTLGGVLHQSLMSSESLTKRPQIFRWNLDAEILVEPISLQLKVNNEGECLTFDLRMRSQNALFPGAHCPPALTNKLKEQRNLWWAYGKGEEMDGREYDSMEPAEQAAWSSIIEQMGLPSIQPAELVRALDEFADCAIDFQYSDQLLESMANYLSMPLEYLEAWQADGDGVIIDVGDDKIQGFC
ncbi:hypothetical protein [Synechococcus lacustris]|uniref:Uncharacterized protein n=1 Tax=Synechococcus lacustris str. Tous TaxID=1910958 RepID=A0A2P7EB38_9SYNE|nr:hypothetical protein [Synechococcus lacustris]PSI00369.1 hypothetical protein C7K08_13535 [Synechococcus lacustris str. Tous]